MRETKVRPDSISRMVTVDEDSGFTDMSSSEELILTAKGELLLGKTFEGSFSHVFRLEKGDRRDTREMLKKAKERIIQRIEQLHAELQTCEAIELQLNQL